MNRTEIKNILEFALLAAGGPLNMADFRRLLDGEEGDISGALAELENEWADRGLRLAAAGDGWQMISGAGYLDYLRRLRPKKPARLSRQLTEVLAIIAYRQPATRGDIEGIRGVAVSSVQLAALEEFGWIEEVGRRETPGRPMLYGTTKTFLHDLAIASLDELPPLEEGDIADNLEDADSLPPPEESEESEESEKSEKFEKSEKSEKSEESEEANAAEDVAALPEKHGGES